jgi:hypothetical protein
MRRRTRPSLEELVQELGWSSAGRHSVSAKPSASSCVLVRVPGRQARALPATDIVGVDAAPVSWCMDLIVLRRQRAGSVDT